MSIKKRKKEKITKPKIIISLCSINDYFVDVKSLSLAVKIWDFTRWLKLPLFFLITLVNLKGRFW